MHTTRRPFLAPAAASLAAGAAMIPFIVVHLLGDVMGEGSSLSTPFDQLAADLSLGGLESALLIVWLALPIAWIGAAVSLACIRLSRSTTATVLAVTTVALGAISVLAYGLATSFLFFAPTTLAAWCIFVSPGEGPAQVAASESSEASAKNDA